MKHPDTKTKVVISFFMSLCVLISCAQPQTGVAKVESLLKSGGVTVDQVLSSKEYLRLHSESSFRSLIRTYAPTGKIAIVTTDEPGERILLKGLIVGKDKTPRKNILFYFYHTMNNGLYAESKDEPGKPVSNSQQVAKLFGYIRTDDEGRFEISTIKPAGYPGERFPSHVHIEVYDNSGAEIFGTEFQFADDPRLDQETLKTTLRYGNLVASNTGTKSKPEYFYEIVLPE